jgi:sugar-phosphatase
MHLAETQAVLADMDGTLVDSDAAVERAWAAWAVEYGIDPEAALADIHGRPAVLTVRRLCPDLDDEGVAAAAARQLALQYDDLSDVAATPGAAEFVSVLDRHRLPWAVVTSADRRLAHARLAAAGLTTPLLVTVEDVQVGKPDPEGYRLAAEELQADPKRCLVVEDSEPGVRAGQAAGCTVAALRGLSADLQIADLGELARLLDQALGSRRQSRIGPTHRA